MEKCLNHPPLNPLPSSEGEVSTGKLKNQINKTKSLFQKATISSLLRDKAK